MTQDSRFAARVFNLVVVAVLAYLLFRIFRPFFGPLLWAALLAFLLSAANVRLRGKLGGRAGLAALVLTLAVAVGIVVPATLVGIAFVRQGVELGQRLAGRAAQYQVGGIEDLDRIPLVGAIMRWVQEHLAVDAAQMQEWIVDAGQRVLQFLLSHTRDALLSALGLFANLILMLFVLFFFLRDGGAMALRLKRLVPLEPARKTKLDRHLQDVTRAVVFGSLATALLQGILMGVAFWIARLPSPVVFGAVTAIASFIPVGGTAFVWIPAALYLVANGMTGKAIFMAAWGALVVGMVDNLVRPLLVSGRAEVGTLTVFFGVLGGLSAFGLIGLFLGPVILALALALLQFAEEGTAAA